MCPSSHYIYSSRAKSPISGFSKLDGSCNDGNSATIAVRQVCAVSSPWRKSAENPTEKRLIRFYYNIHHLKTISVLSTFVIEC